MITESDKFYHRQLIYSNFSTILDSLSVQPLTKRTIDKHKKYINSFNLVGKAQYKTYTLLNSYYNTKFKDEALTSMQLFVNKKCLL